MVPFDGFAYFAVLLFVLPAAVALRLLAPTARAARIAISLNSAESDRGLASPPREMFVR